MCQSSHSPLAFTADLSSISGSQSKTINGRYNFPRGGIPVLALPPPTKRCMKSYLVQSRRWDERAEQCLTAQSPAAAGGGPGPAGAGAWVPTGRAERRRRRPRTRWTPAGVAGKGWRLAAGAKVGSSRPSAAP